MKNDQPLSRETLLDSANLVNEMHSDVQSAQLAYERALDFERNRNLPIFVGYDHVGYDHATPALASLNLAKTAMLLEDEKMPNFRDLDPQDDPFQEQTTILKGHIHEQKIYPNYPISTINDYN